MQQKFKCAQTYFEQFFYFELHFYRLVATVVIAL